MACVVNFKECPHRARMASELNPSRGTGIPAHAECSRSGASCGATKWDPPEMSECPRFTATNLACPMAGCLETVWFDDLTGAFSCAECGAIQRIRTEGRPWGPVLGEHAPLPEPIDQAA